MENAKRIKPINRQTDTSFFYKIVALFLIFVLYLAAALLATYPIVKHIDEKVPFDLGDPLFMSWLVSWNNNFFQNASFSLSTLFNTNIYFPYENTLAFSDLMLIPSLLVFPVFLLTHNPLIAVNVLLIVLLALSAFSMFLLVQYLTKNTFVAFLAGCLYTFSTYHFAQIGHIQLHTDAFFILMLLFLHKWLDHQKPAHLFLAAAMLFLEALSSWYYAIYGGMLFVLFVGYFLIFRQLKLNKRTLLSLVTTVLLLGLIAYPFIAPYLQLHKTLPNFERNIRETVAYSAGPADYLATVDQNLLWGRLLGLTKPGVETVLFPGLAVIILAIIGSFGIRRALISGSRSGQIRLFYMIVAYISLMLSFGPYKIVGGRFLPLPFFIAFELVPGFKSMRVPARFSLLVLLGLVVLASFGAVKLLDFWRTKRATSKWANVAALLVLVFIIFQQISWPIPLSQPVASGNRIPRIYKWLANYENADTVIELPIVQSEQTKYVYYSAYHQKRLVNGYSGYTPPIWVEMEREMIDFPSPRAVTALRELDVNGVLVHTDLIPDWADRTDLSSFKGLTLVKKVGDDYFYTLEKDKSQKIKTRL